MLLNNFKVPGKNLKVRGSLELRTEDIAGETSGTDSVEKGTKPKVLSVSLIVPFIEKNGLTDLIKKAEAKNKKGQRKIYTITDNTANTAGIRQVQFHENLTWQEDSTMQLWSVSFALREFMSNSERKEKKNTYSAEYKKALKKVAGH